MATETTIGAALVRMPAPLEKVEREPGVKALMSVLELMDMIAPVCPARGWREARLVWVGPKGGPTR